MSLSDEELKEARRAYKKQKRNAFYRGIQWDFSYESWLSVWIKSGLFSERGPAKHQYVMARKGDVGPYSVANVRIVTALDNRRESLAITGPLRTRLLASGRGFTRRKNGFQVVVSKKYVGLFPTEEAARNAYLSACEVHRRHLACDPTNNASQIT